MKLTFKNIITEDIRENSRIENAIFKFLDREYETLIVDNRTEMQIAEEVEKIFGMNEWDAIFFTFKWLVKNNYDPIQEGGDREIQYWVENDDDTYQFLIDTGWWDKFFRPYEFRDIVEKGKGKNKQKFIQADSYYDFKPLFDNEWLSDAITWRGL